jgi:hypothetical protein
LMNINSSSWCCSMHLMVNRQDQTFDSRSWLAECKNIDWFSFKNDESKILFCDTCDICGIFEILTLILQRFQSSSFGLNLQSNLNNRSNQRWMDGWFHSIAIEKDYFPFQYSRIVLIYWSVDWLIRREWSH